MYTHGSPIGHRMSLACHLPAVLFCRLCLTALSFTLLRTWRV